MKEKILILGAGIYQAPLIKKVAARGYETMVASIAGRYPGIDLADQFFVVDIRDIEGIVALARTLRITAIVTTGADAGVRAVAAVAGRLGMRGPSLRIAETLSSKTAFRAFQRTKAHVHPDFRRCVDASQAWDFYRSLGRQAIFKPDDASGSRGVTILPPGLPAERVAAAYDHALHHASNSLVCAEAFIDGIEAGANAFFVDGEIVFFSATDKHMDGVVVEGHSIPNPMPAEDLMLLKAEMSRLAVDLGYVDGPMNVDAMISDRTVYLLEVAIRNGGNGIVDLIRHGEGVDLLEMTLDYSLGETVAIPPATGKRRVSSYVFGTDRPGILRSITSLAELQQQVPEVFELVLARNPGERLEALTHNANLAGYLLMHGGSSEYSELVARIRDHLHIGIER